jgi:hypothetical protein
MAWQLGLSFPGPPVSDRASSDNLRAEAARYHAEATEIETGVKTSVAKSAP